jgi:hypothetical protein
MTKVKLSFINGGIPGLHLVINPQKRQFSPDRSGRRCSTLTASRQRVYWLPSRRHAD